MDNLDKRIILELDSNCRVSYQSIALKLGMTANAIKKRVSRLLESGLIERFVVGLSLEMMGTDMVIALVRTDGSEFSKEFVDRIGNRIEVMQVSPVASAVGSLYCVFAQTVGPRGLSDLGRFLRGLEPVNDVEIHVLLYPRGKKVKLTATHMKVLRGLLHDPRATVTELTKRIGLSARRIRRALQELQEGGGVDLAVFWYLGAGGLTEVLVRIEWDDAEIKSQSVVDWLREEYPLEFWSPFISATSATIFARFVVEELEKAEVILRAIRKAPFVASIASLVFYSSHVFDWPGTIALENLLDEAGL
ncbi:MAG: winged helix-turn-helix transcriptional regulator [Candidatus Thorarchaeota archaeon]